MAKKKAKKKYGRKASQKVERAMHEMKEGKLRSGGSGRKVKSRKQAVAIGLSEARREGGKVPAKKSGTRKKKSGAGSKSSARRKSSNRKTSTGRKKSPARKKSGGGRKSSGKSSRRS